MSTAETLSPPMPEVESATSNASDYFRLIAKLTHEKTEPPKTVEEARQRILEAKEAYYGLETPEVDLPDTPEPTLAQLLAEREKQYWLDRDEVKIKGKVLDIIPIDPSPANNGRRLIANLIDDIPGEALVWGVAKTILAGKTLDEVRAAQRFTQNGTLNVAEVLTDDEKDQMVRISLGRARLAIRDGRLIIQPLDFETSGRDLGKEIQRRHLSWEDRHALLSRSDKLRKVLPFIGDVAVGVRSGSQAWDAFQFNALYHVRKAAGNLSRDAHKD